MNKKLIKISLASTAISFSMLITPLAMAATPACGSTINADTTWDSDMSCNVNGGNGITIGANNIVLDCAGHSMTGPGSGYGVELRNKNGVTIKNCNISGFYFGLVIVSSSFNTLLDNSASSNTENGIYISSSFNNTLTGNTVSSNRRYGIFSDSSSPKSNNNIFTFNDVSLNGSDGIVVDGHDNILTSNTANSNYGNGISLYNSVSSSTLTSNTANSNHISGISLGQNSNNNLIENNTANSNSTFGIYLNSNSNNVLTANTAISNSNTGISINSSSGNTITSNIVNSNGNGINMRGGYVGNNLVLSSNNTIASNTVNSNRGYGIAIDSSSNFNTLTSNTASNNSSGIIIESSNTVLTGNAANNNYNGITLFPGSNNNILTNNTASSNTSLGFYLYVSFNNTLTSNIANLNGQVGIFLGTASHDNTITSNTASSNPVGISLYPGSNNNILTSNTFSNNTQYGILMGSVTNNSIVSNKITDSIYCVKITSSTGTNISKNTCKRNQYGIVSDPSSNNSIDSNTLEEILQDGVLLEGSTNDSVTNNSITSALVGVRANNSTGSAVSGNTIQNSSTTILVLNSPNTTLSGNILQNNVNNTPKVDAASAGTLTSDVPTASLDADNDGIQDDADSCPSVSGNAEFNGCPFADKTLIDLHTVDQFKSGFCGTLPNGKPTPECTNPLSGAVVKVFDRDNAELIAQYGKRPKKEQFGSLFESDLGRVGSCVTDASGSCLAGEDHPGHFLVVAKFTDQDGTALYDGKLKNFKNKLTKETSKQDKDDEDTDDAIPDKGTVITKKLHFEQIITKSGTLKYPKSQTLKLGGSLWALVKSILGNFHNDYVKEVVKKVAEQNGINIPEWGINNGTKDARKLLVGSLIDLTSLSQ